MIGPQLEHQAPRQRLLLPIVGRELRPVQPATLCFADLRLGHWVLYEGRSWMVAQLDPRREEALLVRIVCGSPVTRPVDRTTINRLRRHDSRPPWRVKDLGKRGDELRFFGFWSPKAKKILLVAGCRQFANLDDASDHWMRRVRDYCKPQQNRRLNVWSLRRVRMLRALIAAERKGA